MDLLLWRHAEAHDARPGETDLQRALTPRGREQAERMGRWLAEVLPANARVLASPALRTQQTAQALGRPFDTASSIGNGASVNDLLLAAGWPDAPRPVLLVGHQPTLGLVAAWLMSGQRDHWSVKKGGVWWLRSDPHQHATLVAMRTPDGP